MTTPNETEPLVATVPISLDQQIASVMREIHMREQVYPRWVKDKKLLETKANHEIAAMKAVLVTLQQLRENQNAPA